MPRLLTAGHVGPWAAIVVAAIVYGAKVTTIGFNPTDDGFILSQSTRLLGGQTPHLDFISPRPVGSALFHSVTILLPSPLLLTSRWIVLLELGIASGAQVMIIARAIGAPKATLWKACLVILAFAVNLHSFPLMAWHTIDGVFLASIGILMVLRYAERPSTRGLTVGALVAGISVVTKQSFAPVVILVPIIAVWLALPGAKVRALLSSGTVAIPVVVYFAWIWSSGADLGQLLAGGQGPPIRGMLSADVFAQSLALAASIVALIYIVRPTSRIATWLRTRHGLLTLSATQVVVVSWLVVTLARSRLDLQGTWSWTVLWLAVASLAALVALRGSRVLLAALLPVIGLLASLSWGYAKPSLLAGSLSALIGIASVEIWRYALRSIEVRRRGFWRKLSAASPLALAAVAAVSVVVLLLSYAVRTQIVYRDLPLSAQSERLDQIADDLSMLTSNPRMFEVLNQVRSCLDRYPTERLAIVPDGAILPQLFGKTNPLPVDWWYPPEVVDSRKAVLAAVRQSTTQPSGHLVLFQTFAMHGVSVEPAVAREADALFDYRDGFARQLFDTISGEEIRCGDFIGRFQPTQ